MFSREMALAGELSHDANPASANIQVPPEEATSVTSRPAASLASWDFLCHLSQLLSAKPLAERASFFLILCGVKEGNSGNRDAWFGEKFARGAGRLLLQPGLSVPCFPGHC